MNHKAAYKIEFALKSARWKLEYYAKALAEVSEEVATALADLKALVDSPDCTGQSDQASAADDTAALCWFEQGDAARFECGCKACTKWLEENEEHDEHCGCKGCVDSREYSDSIRQDLRWSKGGL